MPSRKRLLAAAALLAAAVNLLSAAPAFRLNSVGYLPDAAKHAIVVAPKPGAFAIVRAADGGTVLTGTLGPAPASADSDEPLALADFSALRTPGEYRLLVKDVGESPVFRVAPDVFREPFRLVTRAMYLWRCGVAVEGEWEGRRFHHDACHLEDAWLDHVTGRHEKLPSLGGWHDAGDYNKYVVNAGVTVGAMLRAWEDFPALRGITLDLPESGGAIPDYLAEIKFETDWLLTLQAADGSVYAKVSTEHFGAFVAPEKELTPRYVCPAGTAATANFVAMLAQASRAFRPFAPDYAGRCLAAARHAYRYLLDHPEDQPADQSKFHTGGYHTTDPDDRLWAAAELWETTGDAAVLRDLETRIRALTPVFQGNFDWAEIRNLGLLTYLYSQREGRDPALVTALQQNLVTVADEIVATARSHAYARPLGSHYYWGGNGGVARQTLILEGAYRLTKNPVYRATSLDAINHLLGRNVHGRSYVTGLGALPPLFPHDRRAGGDEIDRPWPGYLVGGPNPKAADWFDVEPDARTNEIAINWNAALIYAFAIFVTP